MLHNHSLQHRFNLSDPAVEEELYDSRAMRNFTGVDLGREPVPDETIASISSLPGLRKRPMSRFYIEISSKKL